MSVSLPVGPAELARAGFAQTGRAGMQLAEVLSRLGDPDGGEPLVAELATVADPDAALLALVRLLDPRTTGVSGAQTDQSVLKVLRGRPEGRRRLLALLGGSVALGDHLVRHPEHVPEVAAGLAPEPWAIVDAVRGLSGREGADALRVAYRRQIVRVATADLVADRPTDFVPTVGGALADLASAALEGALLLARAETEDEHCCDLAIVGMGKTGGRELNYLSDVDVIFLGGPRGETDESRAMAVGTKLASAVMRLCGQSTGEGALWQVDAALRPEGKQGPLVRSLDSHREYYQRWAKTWEFQALLKARVVAGDHELGARWLELVRPLVWEAASRENFVDDVRAMRRRVEQHVKPSEVERQIKLGPGGLRDIEFSVQLLQLVHGRSDPTLRSGTTLEALAALRDGGYIGRDDAPVLDGAYRLLRTLEHRVQLHRMRRTHLMPTSEAELRRLGRALGESQDPAEAVQTRWREVRRDVRRLHERLFYRPLLGAVARLAPDEARLSPEAAAERLSALGFRDPGSAIQHLEALTEGLSRRAALQRQLLPVMLGWFADGADPDAGLLAFRRISDALASTHWYLGMLRDEGRAAELLARVLSSSRYAVDLLVRSPESVSLLGDEDGLVPPEAGAVLARMRAAAGRHAQTVDSFTAIRSLRVRELVRIVLGDLGADWDGATVRTALTRLTDAYLGAFLEIATRAVLERRGEERAAALVIVGMGRLGGREVGYASDADVMYVYDPLPGADPEVAAAQANETVAELRKGLAGAGPDPVLELDADLRPEGKQGPLVRSLASYASYYDRWSAGWESQALLRARPLAGDEELSRAFEELVRPLRWPEHGIPDSTVREIRTLKARMEAERLPRGADRRTHLKLGVGGLSDVEWVAQLLQLQHAHEHEGLRTTGTLQTLHAAVAAGLMGQHDATVLEEAWSLASQIRDAGTVWRGRPVDSVPADIRDAEGMARVMGRDPGGGHTLADDWMRAGRHARVVVDRLFYGDQAPPPGRAGATTPPRRFGSGSGRTGGFGLTPTTPRRPLGETGRRRFGSGGRA